MLLHFGSTPVLVASTAAAAMAILKTHDRAFSSRPPSAAADHLLYGSKDIAFSPYGEYWRQARRVSTLHLLSPRRVRLMRAVREEEVRAMVEKIRGSSTGTPVNLSELVMEMTNNVVCRVALGKRCNSGDVSGIKEMLSEFLVLLGGFDIGEFVPCLGFLSRVSGLHRRMEKNAREIDGLLETVIGDHLRHGGCGGGEQEEESFVDVLLRVMEEEGHDSSGGFSLERDSMKAIILDMFAAGTHTTFTAIDWAMAELMRNPEVMKSAQAEVREIGNGRSMIVEDDMEPMSYLRLVIREVLRLHPPIPLLVPRASTEDVELHGYRISKGTRTVINAWAVARDPSKWDMPEEFFPDRFRGEEMKPMWDLSGINGYQFVPFGSGRRGCPGAQFAISIIELALANLLFKFDWEIPDGRAEELDMTEAPAFTVSRICDLNLIARSTA